MVASTLSGRQWRYDVGSNVADPTSSSRGHLALPSRRAALRLGAAGAASLLSACAEGEQVGVSSPSPEGPAGGAPPPTAAGTEAATPAATTPSSPAAVTPPREEIVDAFAGHRPAVFGLDVPGVVLRHSGEGVALTFDLCGGPQGESFDHDLWALLQDLEIASTFFVNSRWLEANPSLARELGADPLIEIANHGHEHRPLTVDGRAAYGIAGTRDAGAAFDEVTASVDGLTDVSGAAPLWFRSGTAHCDDVGVRIAEAVGQVVVNFSINGDAGATFSARQVAIEVDRAGNGDIVIAHANRPGSGTAGGLARALPAMLERGVTFVRLADVLPSIRIPS